MEEQIELLKLILDQAKKNLVNRDVVVSQLVASRALIDGLLVQLTGGEELEDCKHPKDRRLNLTVMGGEEHWKCKDCGYQTNE